VKVDWRGFELHPETPPGGISITQLYPAVRMEAMKEYMENFAASFGVYDMRSPERIPNTRRALAVAEFARDNGKLDTFRDLAMQAHWKDGRDLEDDRVLCEIAANAGLDAAATTEALNSYRYFQRVDELRGEASAMGVTGIPTFIIKDRRIVGCQPYEMLADAARKAGATPGQQ